MKITPELLLKGDMFFDMYLKKHSDKNYILDNMCAYDKLLDVAEAKVLEWAYQSAKYNQTRAAKMLNISRGAFRYKLAKYFGSKYIC